MLYNRFMQNIPKSSAAFFQEYRFDTLDSGKHAGLIMERLLAFGDRSEIRWLVDRYGVEDVRRWVQEYGERLLPRRRYELWRALFDLPELQQSKRRQVWPY
jgi:hypothetical protein